jgi:hypothetical protein
MIISLKAIGSKICSVCLVFCLSVLPSLSRDMNIVIPANNWGAVQSLQKGTSISVRMASQDRMEGDFLSLDAESIHLMMDKQERTFPRDSIVEVRQLRVPDRKLNGILIGMGTGTAAGGIAAAASHAPFRGEDVWGVLFVAAGAGLGAVFGFTADTMIKGSKLIYRR